MTDFDFFAFQASKTTCFTCSPPREIYFCDDPQWRRPVYCECCGRRIKYPLKHIEPQVILGYEAVLNHLIPACLKDIPRYAPRNTWPRQSYRCLTAAGLIGGGIGLTLAHLLFWPILLVAVVLCIPLVQHSLLDWRLGRIYRALATNSGQHWKAEYLAFCEFLSSYQYLFRKVPLPALVIERQLANLIFIDARLDRALFYDELHRQLRKHHEQNH